MKSYISNLREKIGSDSFIHPAARIIIENSQKQILIIQRADNGLLGLPAGALEENETIKECMIREVWEETGLKILDLEVIGIRSHPIKGSVTYPNGDQIQYFTIEFYSNKWEGSIHIQDRKEVKSASFMDIKSIHSLPDHEQSTFESLAYYREKGKILLE